MQRVTFTEPGRPPANAWFSPRRNFFTRQFYSLFFKSYANAENQFTPHTPAPHPEPGDIELLAWIESQNLMLRQLKELSQNLFNDNNPLDPEPLHLNRAVHALCHEGAKLQEHIRMQHFQRDLLSEAQDVPHQTSFSAATPDEIQQQTATLSMLFSKTRDLMRHVLAGQTNNGLLLRLFIEEEELVQTLWNQSTLELFGDMFPYQPEMGYVQAGKSYFMAHWLPESLNAYEKALAINSNLSEPRRQTYLIRAMIRDRDHANK